MSLQEDYWEGRYGSGDTPWEKGEPSPGLVDFLAQRSARIPRGTVCVPGCGSGHDVREWARYGFDVTGFDIAPSGVLRAKKETERADVEARFIQADFLSQQPTTTFDWAFEHTFFCAITPHLREAYVRAMITHIRPGGFLLAVHYIIPDKDGPPYGTTRAEVVDWFSPFFTLREEWVPRSYPNRTRLEMMFWWERKCDAGNVNDPKQARPPRHSPRRGRNV